ncbi:MAG: DUF4230 domain-containing protein [Bacteroidota bacterium]
MFDKPAVRYIGLAVVAFLLGFLAYKVEQAFRKPQLPSLESRLAAVQYQARLELVRYHYEALIPVKRFTSNDKKEGQLQFIMTAPAKVNGAIDLDKVQYEEINDTLVEVTLPPAELTDVIIDLDSVRDYSVKNPFLNLSFRMRGRNGGLHYKAYRAIQKALIEAKATVRKKAIQNGVLYRTEKMAEAYMRSMLGNLGYQVRFRKPPADLTLRNEILRSLSKEDEMDSLSTQEKINILKEIQIQADQSIARKGRNSLLNSLRPN